MTHVGVIEGFFGRPWSEAARLAYPEFLHSHGFNFYIYAPKADRYLRRAWRDPYPSEALERLEVLGKHCRERGIRFGIGLTPFEIHLNYDADARSALKRKVIQLNRIGVDILGILFDDMRGGIAALAQLQAEITADITRWSSASAFIVCPTYYSDDPVLEQVFGPPPKHYLRDLARHLDPAIEVFWTGERVISADYPDAHLEEITARLGRRPFIWDNRIANDGRLRCAHLYLDPRLGQGMPGGRHIAGFAINPMNQPNLSRVPLAVYGTGDLDSQLRAICGPALGAALLDDLDLFQNRGLNTIDRAARERLIDKYRVFEPNESAIEIGAWLRGEFEFDPNCLTE